MPTRVTREPRHIPIKDFWALSRAPEFPEKARRDIELFEYKFNVAYEETLFDRAAPKTVKASDWKLR